MLPLARRRQGVVEAHRDVADEQAAGIGDFEAGGRAFDKPVGFKRRERFEFLREVLREVDAEPL